MTAAGYTAPPWAGGHDGPRRLLAFTLIVDHYPDEDDRTPYDIERDLAESLHRCEDSLSIEYEPETTRIINAQSLDELAGIIRRGDRS